ncbi:MAG TPA: acyltransferase, partial [Chitinophagaceae bacterium]|nr:acyltransferase [Chitinophagaceae bacterium]
MNRLHNLDYLRGLAAFGIMLFHYLSWSIGNYSAQTVVGKIGIYGVSIFYVLSGLTLYYVYHNKMSPSKKDISVFMKKRMFRIFPLLWLATIASILLSKQLPDTIQLILNLTGVFGFLDWNANLAIGAWSIGNELVFYIFFPFFILFLKRSKAALVILSIAIAGIYFYFAFEVLSTEKSLEEQWR